jgi:mannose-1-phosphate guanylyltransferase/phosphomannomutase
VLSGRVEADIAGFEVSPGLWVAEGVELDPERSCPAAVHRRVRQDRGSAQLREFTVIGNNVVVKEGAFLHRAVVHNNVYVGQGAPCAAA